MPVMCLIEHLRLSIVSKILNLLGVLLKNGINSARIDCFMNFDVSSEYSWLVFRGHALNLQVCCHEQKDDAAEGQRVDNRCK